jgi:hypothetical protein
VVLQQSGSPFCPNEKICTKVFTGYFTVGPIATVVAALVTLIPGPGTSAKNFCVQLIAHDTSLPSQDASPAKEARRCAVYIPQIRRAIQKMNNFCVETVSVWLERKSVFCMKAHVTSRTEFTGLIP